MSANGTKLAGPACRLSQVSAEATTALWSRVTDTVSGDKTTYSYDTQNRLLDAKTTNGGTTVSDYSYTYDAASNLTKQVDTANGSTDTYSYTVDPDNAVTSETADGVGFRYTDDGDGNLTGWDGGWNLTYNAQNQTTSRPAG